MKICFSDLHSDGTPLRQTLQKWDLFFSFLSTFACYFWVMLKYNWYSIKYKHTACSNYFSIRWGSSSLTLSLNPQLWCHCHSAAPGSLEMPRRNTVNWKSGLIILTGWHELPSWRRRCPQDYKPCKVISVLSICFANIYGFHPKRSHRILTFSLILRYRDYQVPVTSVSQGNN